MTRRQRDAHPGAEARLSGGTGWPTAGAAGPLARLLVAAALCGAIVASPASGQAKAPGAASLSYQGVDPGTVRDFDLAGGRIIDPLPFDVQFYLQSPVDTNVRRVSGKLLQRKRLDQACHELFPADREPQTGYLSPLTVIRDNGEEIATAPSPPQPRAAPPEPPGDARGLQFVRFISVGQPTGAEPAAGGENATPAEATPVTASARTVEMSVPAPGLLPNRELCFAFDIERQVDLEAFRQNARNVIDLELRDPRWVALRTVGGELERTIVNRPSAYNRMRRSVLRRVLAGLKPGERLVAREGSYFDPHVNLSGVRDTFLQRFNDVLAEQIRRFAVLDGIRGTPAEPEGSEAVAEARLLDLQADATFRTLAQSSIARDLLDGEQGILALTVGGARDRARGRVAGAAALDPEQTWDAAAIGKAADEMEKTIVELGDLQRVIRHFRDRPQWIQSEGLSADGLAGLENLVESAVAALRKNAGETRKLRDRLSARGDLIEEMVNEMAVELEAQVVIQATTVADYETRAAWYLSADVGAGFAPDVEELFTYVGTNIYFRPVNKKAPLRGLQFRRRFSIMVGLANETLQRDGQLKGVIGNSALLFAGGLRLNDHLRLSVGALLFEDEDPNPLITDARLAWSPFISLSIDWNLRRIFTEFGGVFGLNGKEAGSS